MKVRKSKSAWLLVAGAIFALSVTILSSCSSDEDYDMYMGDELRTHAAATRSASAESGTAIYEGSLVRAGHTFIFETQSTGGWDYQLSLQWTRGYTGNMHGPYSSVIVPYCDPIGQNYKRDFGWAGNNYGFYKKTFLSASASWGKGDVIIVTFKYSANDNEMSSPFVYDASTFTLNDIKEFVSFDEVEDSVENVGSLEGVLE